MVVYKFSILFYKSSTEGMEEEKITTKGDESESESSTDIVARLERRLEIVGPTRDVSYEVK